MPHYQTSALFFAQWLKAQQLDRLQFTGSMFQDRNYSLHNPTNLELSRLETTSDAMLICEWFHAQQSILDEIEIATIPNFNNRMSECSERNGITYRWLHRQSLYQRLLVLETVLCAREITFSWL